MNLFLLSWSYIKRRKLATFLNILLLAIGIASIVLLLLVGSQLEENMTNNGQDIDLVVGAKGSPTQLILSSIYHADVPTGNISVEDAESIGRNNLVGKSIPLSIGDSFEGVRIVGTTIDYLDLYEAEVVRGEIWDREGEVVVGSQVASEKQLALGDELVSSHGLSGGEKHDDHAMTVVGILNRSGTVLDRLILTSSETIWDSHSDESEIDLESIPPHLREMASQANKQNEERQYTALLIQYASSAAAASFPRFVNSQTNLQAASPAVETTRLFSLLEMFFKVIRGFAFILVLASIIGLFIAMFNALRDRDYDLALLRTLGGSRTLLFKHILLEGFILSLAGGVLGIILGHLGTSLFGSWTESRGLPMNGLYFHSGEFIVLGAVILLGLLAACIPAYRAFNKDIDQSLSKSI